MKKLILLFILTFSLSVVAQEKFELIYSNEDIIQAEIEAKTHSVEKLALLVESLKKITKYDVNALSLLHGTLSDQQYDNLLKELFLNIQTVDSINNSDSVGINENDSIQEALNLFRKKDDSFLPKTNLPAVQKTMVPVTVVQTEPKKIKPKAKKVVAPPEIIYVQGGDNSNFSSLVALKFKNNIYKINNGDSLKVSGMNARVVSIDKIDDVYYVNIILNGKDEVLSWKL